MRTRARYPATSPVEDGLATLVNLARATGGDYLSASRFTRSIASAVRDVFEDVRAGYVLYYEPAGISGHGWHPIEVTLSRPGQFTIRARPGYTD